MRFADFAGWIAGLIFIVSLALPFGTVVHFAQAIVLAMHTRMSIAGDTAFLLIAFGMSAKNILIAVLGVRTALRFGTTAA